MSTGVETNGIIDTPTSEMVIGAINGTANGGFWLGESTTGDNTPLNGAHTISDTAAVNFATPNSGSTTLDNRAVGSFVGESSFNLAFTGTDGTRRRGFWWALGVTATPPPPPVITTYATRRERVFSLPFEMNLWVFLQRLEILVQSGVGLSTGQGSDPKLMLSISRDGGHTYGNEMQLGVGKIGEYQARAFANRLGRGRNLVCKVACSDPVFFALLACFIDAEAGTS